MKCKYCGGNITLESAFCPYCGKTNEHAQQHAKNMKHYQRVYEKTRKGVQETAHRYTGTTVRMILIAALVVLVVVLLLVSGNSYSIRRRWIQNKAEKNAAQVMAQMNQYLEDKEFFAFSSFCTENYIDTFETVFAAYVPEERASKSFSYVYQDIMKIACPPSYREKETLVEHLVEDLEYFYENLDMSKYEYYDDIDVEKSQSVLQDMEDQVKILLCTYCGLSQEQADNMKTMSKAKRAVALEEAILGE